MKRGIAIISIVLILLTIATIEEIFISKTTTKLYELAVQLINKAEANEDNLNSEENMQLYEELRTFWSNSEKKLSVIINYESIKNVTEAIAKLEISLKENDKSVTYENLLLIKNYGVILRNILGFNFQNLL